MSRDWIQEAKVVAAELKVFGLDEEPRRIIEAIEAGATGGEILMAIRWNLNEILKTNPDIQDELKERITDIAKGITVTLDG